MHRNDVNNTGIGVPRCSPRRAAWELATDDASWVKWIATSWWVTWWDTGQLLWPVYPSVFRRPVMEPLKDRLTDEVKCKEKKHCPSVTPGNFDRLQWWTQRTEKFSLLSDITRRVFIMPHERHFSAFNARHVVTSQRIAQSQRSTVVRVTSYREGKSGRIRTDYHKIWYEWLSRRCHLACQNSNRSPQWGRRGKWVKYQSCVVFSFFLFYRSLT